ncbi:ChaN family lipoprotein [Roseovarius nanhaiticus]|uniref:ChaN family lipoprotein n=1 Tax=Roseovarius nanhaiticus TaxID=573024 RepID=UPI00249176F9|nr:ChaN family lipoprotein [Roseovarius nanhaiticus]
MRLALLLACLAAPAIAAASADIVILGEVHDNPDAHLGQADAVRNLAPTAVVFEMLTAAEAKRADADRGLIAEAWAKSGWQDFPIYSPIFDALGAARIVGAAAPRDTVRAVFTIGPADLFGPEAPRYGLDAALPEDQQRQREDQQFDAHCAAMPRGAMAGMVAVQRYRDAAFARSALAALDRYGPPVAVIVGNGHARTDWGVPAMIARAAPAVTTHAIGFVEQVTDMPFDEIRVVPPADRDDPCKSLASD